LLAAMQLSHPNHPGKSSVTRLVSTSVIMNRGELTTGLMAEGDRHMAQGVTIGPSSPRRALKFSCGCYYKLRLTAGVSGLEEGPEKGSVLG